MNEAARILLSLAGPIFFVLAGAGFTRLLPALDRKPRGLRAAYAYLFGLAWISGASWALSHFLHAPLSRGLFLALGAVGALPALLPREKNRADPPPASPRP